MLSFLREQGQGDLKAEKPDAVALEGDTQGPLDQEYFTVAAKGRRARKARHCLPCCLSSALCAFGS